MRLDPIPMTRIAELIVRCVGALAVATALRAADPSFRPIPLAGMANTFAVGSRLYSGSSPVGDAAFAALAGLGVRTIVSVDGAAPDAASAVRHGIRYIHLPFGYDGIPASNAVRLVKAVGSVAGPVYFHCHHGKHRGPAAVAVVCEAIDGWKPALAHAWMHAAGTATNYAGLYRSAAEFRPPLPAELAAVGNDFPSRAPTPGLVDAMVSIDARFDGLKSLRKAGFGAAIGRGEGVPSDEALQLVEWFREARRTGLGAERGPRWADGLSRAETAARRLHESLRNLETARSPEAESAVETCIRAVSDSCAACHKAVRD